MNIGTKVKIEFEALKKASSTWQIYSTSDDNIMMARVMKNGKMGKPHIGNLLCMSREDLNEALVLGAAVIL